MHRLQDPGRDPRKADGVDGSPDPERDPCGEIVKAQFSAAKWCLNPHLQTFWPYLFRSHPRPAYRRERVELPDGDFIDLDWCGPEPTDTLVVILHGLEGSSSSHYVRALSRTLANLDVSSAVMHQRGCSGVPNRLPRFYHGGATEDFRFVLERCKMGLASTRLYAVGYSLGANILLKWLGQAGDNALLEASVAVSVPFLLDDGARRLERGFSRIYQTYLINSMKRSVKEKRRRMNYPIDDAAVSRCRTFEQIDTCLTAPLHGFRDASDYYEKSSCRQFLSAIRTRTLIIHARDDPFMTPGVIPTKEELSPTVRLELSRHGGHCGFIAESPPWQPRYWLDERIPEFIHSCIGRRD